MSLARNTFVQTSFTLISRLLGYARDRAISNVMGAGPIGDAFATAQMFPNLFRRLFAEGAFSQAFVPVYARTQAEQGEGVAAQVASQSLSVLTLTTIILTIGAQIAMPWIMLLIHGGYANQPRYLHGLRDVGYWFTLPDGALSDPSSAPSGAKELRFVTADPAELVGSVTARIASRSSTGSSCRNCIANPSRISAPSSSAL